MIRKYLAVILSGIVLASIVVGCKKSNKPADNESISTTMEDIKYTSAVDETEENDTSEITEETTTEGVENETTKEDMEEETSATEEITTECESESETEPVTEPSLESETETESHSSEYEQEITTTQPTEAPTAKPMEPATEPPTEPPTTEKVYYDPYTWEIISKEEYESIWDAINNPKPTEPPTKKENVYVFNDDGTINFKESTFYLNVTDIDEELMRYVYESHEVKDLIPPEYYRRITCYGLSKGTVTPGPFSFWAYIGDEFTLIIGFDDNFIPYKNGRVGGIDAEHPPIKTDW